MNAFYKHGPHLIKAYKHGSTDWELVYRFETAPTAESRFFSQWGDNLEESLNSAFERMSDYFQIPFIPALINVVEL